MLSESMRKELDDLVRIADGQGGIINANLVYIATDNKKVDYQECVNYLQTKNIEIIADDIEPENSDSSLGNSNISPFDPKEIDITMQPLTIDSLIKRIRNEEVEFNSAFQRKAGLWTTKQKSQLIESILLRIPLPAFYFDASNEDQWVIIDGLQRTTTLKEFVIDKSLKLEGMEFFGDLDGKYYDELPRLFQRRIDETQINVYLVNPSTPENVKFNIFKRINTGGLLLQQQEIRNALYQGKATTFLKKLSKMEVFLNATSYSIPSDRMMDQEFVLRFVSFCYLDEDQYTGVIDNFLNQGMKLLNRLSQQELKVIENKFISVMSDCRSIFDPYTFRKMGRDGRRRPINKVIYEVWCMQIKNMNKKDINILIKGRAQVKDKFLLLCEDEGFLSSIKGSDRKSLYNRKCYVETMVNSLLIELGK